MASNRLKEKYKELTLFFTDEIWDLNPEELSKYRSRLLRHTKVVIITIINFGRQNLGGQAVALSFFSTMAFVPFVAVIFTITRGFGLEPFLLKLLYNNIEGENQLIIEKIMGFANNIIETAKTGPYGLISFLVFVWLVIWLLICVENSFNKIWKVEKKRKIQKRFAVNIAILLISPFLIILFLSMSWIVTKGFSPSFNNLPFISEIGSLISWGIFYLISVAVFSIMYKFIPRTKVQLGSAIQAAFISGLAFTIIQYLYMETQIFVSRLNAVYGIFAAIPLFMVWINIAWFVILIGSEISYAFQTVDTLNNNNICYQKNKTIK